MPEAAAGAAVRGRASDEVTPVVALRSSVTKNWQTLLEFARTLPPEDEAITATRTLPSEGETSTATRTTLPPSSSDTTGDTAPTAIPDDGSTKAPATTEDEIPTVTTDDGDRTATAAAITDGKAPAAVAPAATDDRATATPTPKDATIPTPPPRRLRQHHTRLTPVQKDEVITLYQQGVLVREICQRYGISKQQVSDLRNARGISRRPRGLSDEQKRQAEQHYLAGQSCATIGRQFGVHAETVRRYLHTTGITLRPRRGAA